MRDLEQAIETISEGGTALGVSCDDVYEYMLGADKFALLLFKGIHSGEDIQADFASCFCMGAKKLLKEALRAKMENDNGLD